MDKAAHKITVLPVYLVNKIAAGEVIERPASVVKELVENAIDAGATRIDVAVEDGGRRLISVSDNGCGMDAADLALAFVPHATSKIVAEDDLYAITTMGFRGEALASIASVSHAHIRTRRPAAGDNAGYEVEASGEAVGDVRPCAAAAGTTITIRDLFFNTPARRKFMKSPQTEAGHIAEQFMRLALANPRIAFTLTHNGRSVHNLPACDSTLQRAGDIFGAELAASLIPMVSRKGAAMAVAGLAGRPDAARASAAMQYCFLNGRYIRDRLLSHAIKEAYRGIIDPSRCPVAFVFLEIAPAEVDVNVHPTKIEVRFRDSQQVHSLVLAALRETLNRANLSPGLEIGDGSSARPTPASTRAAVGAYRSDSGAPAASAPPSLDAALEDRRGTDPVADDRRASLRQALADFFKSSPSPQPRLQFGESAPARWAQRHTEPAAAPALNANPFPPVEVVKSQATAVSAPAPSTNPAAQAEDVKSHATGMSSVESEPVRSGVRDGLGINAVQIHNSYIVTQTPEGLEIIDQHALHERVLYNELKTRLTQGAIASQRMLIPQTLSATPAQVLAAQEYAEMLSRLGIEVEPFGPSALAIQQFPLLLTNRGVDAAEFLRETLDNLGDPQAPAGSAENLLEHLLETMACKAAVKAGDPLTTEELRWLLAAREELEKGSSCPHGRPTTLKLTLKDLQKQFKRT